MGRMAKWNVMGRMARRNVMRRMARRNVMERMARSLGQARPERIVFPSLVLFSCRVGIWERESERNDYLFIYCSFVIFFSTFSSFLLLGGHGV